MLYIANDDLENENGRILDIKTESWNVVAYNISLCKSI